jgi:hypothetical protein
MFIRFDWYRSAVLALIELRMAAEAKRKGTHDVTISSYMIEIYKDVCYDLYWRVCVASANILR